MLHGAEAGISTSAGERLGERWQLCGQMRLCSLLASVYTTLAARVLPVSCRPAAVYTCVQRRNAQKYSLMLTQPWL